MSLLSDMGPSIFAATIAAAASAMVGIVLNGDGVGAEVGNGNERLFHSSHTYRHSYNLLSGLEKNYIKEVRVEFFSSESISVFRTLYYVGSPRSVGESRE